jgi:hypothetical protein
VEKMGEAVIRGLDVDEPLTENAHAHAHNAPPTQPDFLSASPEMKTTFSFPLNLELVGMLYGQCVCFSYRTFPAYTSVVASSFFFAVVVFVCCLLISLSSCCMPHIISLLGLQSST